MTYPIFGVLFANAFLRETLSIYQLLGLIIAMLGVYTMMCQKKVASLINEPY